MEKLKVEKTEFTKLSLRTEMCKGCYYNLGNGCTKGCGVLCVRSWSGSNF